MTIDKLGRVLRACASGKFARRLRRGLGMGGLGLVALALVSEPVSAQLAGSVPRGVIVIRNDRGGLVRKRAAEIERLRAAHQRVEISGRICLSSCTMYLGLPDTCVNPATRFGFHGPSYFGARLSAPDFEYWSRVIASHYPEPLRSWYMRVGRTRIASYYRISGRELIRMGIRQC